MQSNLDELRLVSKVDRGLVRLANSLQPAEAGRGPGSFPAAAAGRPNHPAGQPVGRPLTDTAAPQSAAGLQHRPGSIQVGKPVYGMGESYPANSFEKLILDGSKKELSSRH